MLKSLELCGFKSFADRTRFDFASGITGVVGPNGSGKSNVVDSIKWLLGDQSAKSLRGKEMTDVIFNGALGRKPNNFAEATLTFDNTTGYLPTDLQEVSIGRRIWRNGDSEYLINNTTARLKDVKEMLMGTGAGAAAYCIIEQGRVDQILQGNASSRRVVFEEAAGISRYKSRKQDAERKLERVGQNLLRLTDIVDEVEARLNALRSQAEKAAKFRTLSQDLRENWLGLAADDYRLLSQKQTRLQQQLSEQQKRKDAIQQQHQQIEQKLAAIDDAIAEIDEQAGHVSRAQARQRETIASHQTTLTHEATRSEELSADLVRLKKQRLMMVNRVSELAAEGAHNQKVLQRYAEEFASQKQELLSNQKRCAELKADIDQLAEACETDRNATFELMRQQSLAESQSESLQNKLAQTTSEKKSNEQRLQDLKTQLQTQLEKCEAYQQQYDNAADEVEQLQSDLNELTQRKINLQQEHGEKQQSLAEMREERSGILARLHVLDDLEKRQEGLAIGVKEILNRARTSNYAPWSAIRGSVCDLIEVELEYAALLEVALGPRMQLIVIDQMQPLIEYLNSGHCQIMGRVGFLEHRPHNDPDKNIRETYIVGAAVHREYMLGGGLSEEHRLDRSTILNLSGQPGVIDRIDQFIKPTDRLPGLSTQLLADTWVVESLDVGMQLAQSIAPKCRFITLEGELLESDGTIIVGSLQTETAVVSRKSELRLLKNKLIKIDALIKEKQQEQVELDGSVLSAVQALQSQEQQLKTANENLLGLKSDLSEQQQIRNRINKDHTRHSEELLNLQKICHQLRDEIQLADQKRLQLKQELQAKTRKIVQQESAIQAKQEQLKQIEEEQTAARLLSAKQEERLENLRKTNSRFEQELAQRVAQRDEAIRRLDATHQKYRETQIKLLNVNAAISELYLDAEKLDDVVSDWQQQKLAQRNRRKEIAQEDSELRAQSRSCEQQAHNTEIQLRDVEFQLQALHEKTEEEYQLTLAEVVSSDASAFRIYLLDKTGQFQRNAHAERPPAKQTEADSDEQTVNENESDYAATVSEQVESANSSDHQATAAAEPLADFEIGSLTYHDITFEDVREEIESKVSRLKRKLKLLGSVDTESLQNLDELESRYLQLSSQLEDLVEARNALEEIIRRINSESKRLFSETFDSIQEHFRDLYRKLFGGGEADIVLEDPDDILECGIDIVARPPGKELRSISLLSGGEKTLTAVALLLALFKSRPSPFCILDEVDAALDEANIDRFIRVLDEFKQMTQFIMITHSKRSMTVADILYGVTMEQSGVSKRMSVRFEDVNEHGEFRTNKSTESSDQAA